MWRSHSKSAVAKGINCLLSPSSPSGKRTTSEVSSDKRQASGSARASSAVFASNAPRPKPN
eukprot:8514063-Lingulodinium_polyedra.AAC.2